MTRCWTTCLALAALGAFCAGCGDTDPSDSGPTEGFLCGTDGKTYSVEEADRDEPEIRHRGRCEEPMDCDSPEDCFVGDECRPGSAAQWCIPGPKRCHCPGVFEPVCGGDGRNYINACEAACAEVEVRHEAYCEKPPGQGCVRAGCSDHLCVAEGMDVASTCEWRPVYECYQQAACERQLNGQCGFTPNQELLECLERHGEGMCRIDPRWQDGFQAECESPQAPGIVGLIAVTPQEMMRLGQWFGASYALIEPDVFAGVFPGEGLLYCDGERTLLQGLAPETPLGELEFQCVILPETTPGECNEDGDCPPGHYCERIWPRSDEGMGRDADELPPGLCMDLCALIDCAPGYVCELGECVPQSGFCSSDEDCSVGWICPQDVLVSPIGEGICERCNCLDIYEPVCGVDGLTYGNGCEARCAHVPVAYEGECQSDCPVETHIRNSQGDCVPKCYGDEQCEDAQRCNSAQVCRQDPACPECDVCVGWCVAAATDCRADGCEPGWTCDYCQTDDGNAEWICLPPNAGACLPPDECRPTGCNAEICASEDVASPCVALPEHACYREHGVCELQEWGQCGWTPTPELDECLSQFDCRSRGCGDGMYCSYCWTSWECIPEGAAC